jgi:RNA recognition motif-containing protein
MRGCDVHPVRLVWRGGRGFAFLHFQTADNAHTAVKALAGLEIDGRELNVELARQDNRRNRKNRQPREAASSESANQDSLGGSDVAVEGADR